MAEVLFNRFAVTLIEFPTPIVRRTLCAHVITCPIIIIIIILEMSKSCVFDKTRSSWIQYSRVNGDIFLGSKHARFSRTDTSIEQVLELVNGLSNIIYI
jgi:hypothetical protein